jgi:hypothetical protein
VHGLADEHDELRAAVDEVLASETDPVRQVVAAVGIAGDDAAAGWRSLAEDLERAVAAAGDERPRRQLRRLRNKANELAKTAAALRRDVDRLLASTEVGR